MQIFEKQKAMLEKSLKVKIFDHKISIFNHDAENYEIRARAICWRDKAEEAYVNPYMLLKKRFETLEHFTYPNSSDIGGKYTLRYKGHLFHIIVNHYSMSIHSDAPVSYSMNLTLIRDDQHANR